jgi:glyoxylase-like metal-dependent hydrolase (beta-lactamase superfamily II)
MTTAIIPIRLSLSNAYLVKGSKTVIVDTGSPDEAQRILGALRKAGVSLGAVSLILHTHGHSEHCGSTAELQRMGQIPVAIHRRDADMLQRGRNDAVTPTSLEARLLKPFIDWLVDKPFEGVSADILIEKEMSLEAFGVRGQIIFTPGHTNGSLSVLVDDRAAIVGDLIRGGYLGGGLFPRVPNYHYFADNLETVKASIRKVMTFSPKLVFVGHGGPLKKEAIWKRFSKDIAF